MLETILSSFICVYVIIITRELESTAKYVEDLKGSLNNKGKDSFTKVSMQSLFMGIREHREGEGILDEELGSAFPPNI